MKHNETECLKQALRTLEAREFAAYDRLNDPLPPYSEAHETKMRKLFSAGQQTTVRSFLHTRRRRVFGVLCAVLLICAMTLSVAAVRETLFRFAVDVQEDGIKFSVNETDGLRTILAHYTIDHIPEGYTLQKVVRYDNFHRTMWGQEDRYISLDQATLHGSNTISVSRKENDGEMLNLRGTEMFHTVEHATHLFLWSEDGYIFTFTCPDVFSWEEVVSMVEDIHPETP